MKKKDGVAAPSKASLEEAFKCGQCLHFKQSRHRSFDDVCSKMGIRSFAIAPSCFTPDVTKVIKNTDEFVQLAALMHDKTPEQRKIMLGIFRSKPGGRKHRMGTQLYLNFRGREYISNYLCGYVVMYTSANEIMLCGSPDRDAKGRAFFAYLKSDESLLTAREWRERYMDLRNRGRIQDPQTKAVRNITAKVEADTYEVPTIDNAPKDPNAKKPVNKDSRSTSLVQILKF